MVKLSDEKEAELLKEANDRWEECDTYYSDQYSKSTEDWRFLHGIGQWDSGSEQQRDKEGRPSLTLNQLLPYAQQATNDIKQANLAIRVIPIDSNADVDTAEVRAGIIRNIEKQSSAKDVYGTAAMNAIGAGFGWIRIEVDYADNDSFDQEAFINRVLDFTSVYIDPQSTEVDGSDAEYGFVKLYYTKDRFEELYPDHEAVSFDDSGQDDEICIAEYYYKEYEKDTIHEVIIEDRSLILTQEAVNELDEMEVVYEKKRSRDVERVKVYHCILSGSEVIEREEFPSTFIPLVPVIGSEVWMDSKRECHSLIRQAKDAQRMYNYWKSASTEIIALQPKAPYIAPVGSFQSYPNKWEQANTQNYAMLEYDVVFDKKTGQPLPPPTRTPPIQGSPVMMQEAANAREDIRLGIGMPQANMGERTNVISGVALRTQQIEGDNATFHFIDNLSSSISQVGRILNEIITAVYSERKIARIIGEDGSDESVPINTPYMKDKEGIRAARQGESYDGVHDLSTGKYDIDMDVGASYSSQRQETADKLIEVAKIQPQILDVAGDIVFESLDIPMGREIAKRLKTTMPPEMLGDDPEAERLKKATAALKQMEEQLANYEAALEDKTKNEKFDQSIKAEKAQLERSKFKVDAEKTQADIRKIDADIQNTNMETANEAQVVIDNIQAQVSELGLTMNSILDDVEEDIMEAESLETSEPVNTDATQEMSET